MSIAVWPRMSGVTQGLGLTATAFLMACTAEVPQTTADERCAQYEWTETISIPEYIEDVLVVAERSTATQAEQRLRELIRTFANGDLDGDARRDIFAASHARLRLSEPARVSRVLEHLDCVKEARREAIDARDCEARQSFDERSRCVGDAYEAANDKNECNEPPGFVRYRWSPYGYADDLADFVDRAIGGNVVAPARDCKPLFPSNPIVVILTEHDICVDGKEYNCDPRLTSLVEYAQDEGWPLFVFAGVPVELASTSEWARLDEQLEEERFFEQLLEHPSQQASSTVGCTSNDLQAAPRPACCADCRST